MKMRFRPKFGLLFLMMLTAILAGCAAFVAYRIKTVQRENDAVEKILRQLPSTTFTYQHQLKNKNTSPVGPAFLRRWLGENIFCNVAKIKFWEVDDTFDFQLLTAFNKLKRLELDHTSTTIESLQSLRNFPYLPQVQDLSIQQSPRLTSLDGIENLPNIKSLRVNICNELTNIDSIKSLEKLKELFIDQSDSISDVSPIGNLSRLNRLSLWGCESIKTLEGLEALMKLESVQLNGNFHLESIQPLANCTDLRSISCDYCEKLASIDALAEMHKLEEVSLEGCRGLKCVNAMRNSKGLRRLNLGEMGQLQEVDFLLSCSLMEELTLPESLQIEDASVFKGMSKLRSVCVYAPKLEDLHPLQHLESLESVTIYDARSLKSVTGIAHHSGLKKIFIANLKSLEQATFTNVSQLKELYLIGIELLPKIKFLKPVDQLQKLTVLNGKQLQAIEFSVPPQALQFLRLVDCQGLKDGSLDFISDAASLRHITLEGLAITKLPDLSGLAELESFRADTLQHLGSLAGLRNSRVENLRIANCDSVKDFSFLEECGALKHLDINDCRHHVDENQSVTGQ